MKRPEPTRQQTDRFITASKFRYRVELVLDFDRPISVAKSREVARKTLDSLQAVSTFDAPQSLAEVNLKCWELRRMVKVKVEPESNGSL